MQQENHTSGAVFKRAKILATIGPSTHSYEKIEALVRAGTNGFRLNCSHGTNEERLQQIKWVRAASKVVGKPVAVLLDLQGPKIRCGAIDGVIPVKADEEWTLAYGQATNEEAKLIEVQYDLSQKMQVGEPLFIFDGKIATVVTAIDKTAKSVTVRTGNEGIVMARKGLNLPETDFGGDILTAKDLKDIEFGVAQDIDYVALSFVQTAADVRHLRELLESKGSKAKVVAKVETKIAIKESHLEEIITVSDGVMVARGDLAVEAGAEVVPIVQREIIGLCQKHGKISIVATQMMASMVDAPSPTRAEVSDVAHAVITGADCVMLSDETAMGHYPIETVTAMKKVILYTQQHAPVRPVYFREGVTTGQQDAISSAAVTLAQQVNATAIVAETKSGATALSIASHRPSLPIITVTSDARVAQQLALLYANKSFLRPDGERAGLALAGELREQGFLPPNSTVVLVSGRQPGVAGMTDTIRVRHLE